MKLSVSFITLTRTSYNYHTIMKKALQSFLLLLLAFNASAQALTTFEFKTHPYLQNMNNNGVSVLWMTNKSCTSYVLYGETPTLNQKAFASHNGQIDANVPVQKIRLANLQAGKTYYYQVVSKEIKVYEAYKVVYGDSVKSELKSFTLPSPQKTKFNFLAFNDVHDRPTYIDTVCTANPDFDFVCYNGDIMGDIYNEEQILNGVCRISAKAFGAEKPFFYTRGNHETRGPESRLLSQFIESPKGSYYYSFEWGNSIFMIIDTGEDKQDTNKYYYGLADYDQYRSEQALWVKSVIASKEWKNAAHRIVCGHIPATLEPATENEHGANDISTKIAPLLNAAKVDAYICGHTHRPKIERPNKFHSYPIIVGGGPVSQSLGSTTTFAKVIIDGSKLTVELHRKNGSLIDSIEVK